MMRHIATIAMVSVVVTITTGCSDEETRAPITGVERAGTEAFSVAIRGPSLITTPGFHEWHAEVRGGDGEVSYEWTLLGAAAPMVITGADDASLTLVLDDYFDGRLELTLVVRSGDRAALATEYVTMCPQRHAVDWCFPKDLLER